MSDELNEELDSQNQPSEEDVNTTDTEDSSVQEDDKGAESDKDTEVFKRAKKAEAENKELKRKLREFEQQKQPIQTNPTHTLSEDETIFIAQGHDKEDLEKVRGLMKGFGLTFEQAQNHDLYQAFAKDKAEKIRREKAKLGGSKGSGTPDKAPVFKEGMTSQERREAWNKAMGL